MPKCPKCYDGKIYVVCPPLPEPLDCDICGGTAEISEEQFHWINRGQELRRLRRSLQLGPSEAARRLGMPPSQLLTMEHGRIKPDETLFERIANLSSI